MPPRKQKKAASSPADEKSSVEKAQKADSWLSEFAYSMFDEVPAHSLVFLRIFWGLVMAYEMYTYMANDFQKTKRYLVEPVFMFHYSCCPWTPRLTLAQWKMFFYVLMGCSLSFAAGFLLHLSGAVFCIGFTLLFLQDMGLYLNHFYLIALLAALYMVMPANRFYALDATLGLAKRSATVPYWTVFSGRAIISIVYVFAGICKINEDWLRCEPLLHWIPNAAGRLPFGLGDLQDTAFLACLFSYGGLLMDTFIPALLHMSGSWRFLAFLVTISFHVTNKLILNIGIFPYVMMVISTLYFDPDWPIQLVGKFGLVPAVAPPVPRQRSRKTPLTMSEKAVLGIGLLFFTHQILYPLRHHFYPGNVVWNEEGHRFSWRMKLRDKSGLLRFHVVNPQNNETILVADASKSHGMLASKQARKMPGRPEMIHIYAHELAKQTELELGYRPRVYALSIAAVNFRQAQYLVDPNVDLAAIDLWSWPNKWVTPLVDLYDIDWRYVPRPSMLPIEGVRKYKGWHKRAIFEAYGHITLEMAQHHFGTLPNEFDPLEVDEETMREFDQAKRDYYDEQRKKFEQQRARKEKSEL